MVLRIFVPNKPVRSSFAFPMTIGFSPSSAAKHTTSVNLFRSSFTLPHPLSSRSLISLCALDEFLSAIEPVVPSPLLLTRKKYSTASFVKISLKRNRILLGVLKLRSSDILSLPDRIHSFSHYKHPIITIFVTFQFFHFFFLTCKIPYQLGQRLECNKIFPPPTCDFTRGYALHVAWLISNT